MYVFYCPFIIIFKKKTICNPQCTFWLISETFCSSSVFFSSFFDTDVVVVSGLRPPQGCHPGNVCLRPPLPSTYSLLFKLFFSIFVRLLFFSSLSLQHVFSLHSPPFISPSFSSYHCATCPPICRTPCTPPPPSTTVFSVR